MCIRRCECAFVAPARAPVYICITRVYLRAPCMYMRMHLVSLCLHTLYLYVYLSICIYEYMCMCTRHASSSTCACVHAYMCMCTCLYVHVYMLICACVRYVYVCVTHVYMSACGRALAAPSRAPVYRYKLSVYLHLSHISLPAAPFRAPVYVYIYPYVHICTYAYT